MLIGQETIKNTFKKLIKNGGLSHGYIFFGEPSVGKYSFALSLASSLEGNDFKEVEIQNGLPSHILREALVIKKSEGSIGIDAIREIKYFLSEKPIVSERRVVIIDDADSMTPEAQHAMLKIGEEPPITSLIILITANPDSLVGTLRSRFQKIYFAKTSKEEISSMLVKAFDIDDKRANDIAALSFGRPGRAVSLVLDDEAKNRFKTALSLLNGKLTKSRIIEEITANPDEMYPLLTEIIAKLANNPIKNYDTLRLITNRISAMSEFSTNKRLQLEAALWTI